MILVFYVVRKSIFLHTILDIGLIPHTKNVKQLRLAYFCYDL